MEILEVKTSICACLLSSEGCDAFSEHLDLALVPNGTNEVDFDTLSLAAADGKGGMHVRGLVEFVPKVPLARRETR